MICFIITLGIILMIALVDVLEWEESQRMELEPQQPMSRKDKLLILPKAVLISTFISVPAPLTLAFYAIAVALVLLSDIRKE